MVGTVTLGIDRYNALYKRALQADALEKENAELRERLDHSSNELNTNENLDQYKIKNVLPNHDFSHLKRSKKEVRISKKQ